MRIDIDPRLPSADQLPPLRTRLFEVFKSIAVQLNSISEGRMSAFHNAYTAAPTTGTWAAGDYIKKSNPTEAGIATAKYIIIGWTCTVGGTPGTWLENRTLTGN